MIQWNSKSWRKLKRSVDELDRSLVIVKFYGEIFQHLYRRNSIPSPPFKLL